MHRVPVVRRRRDDEEQLVHESDEHDERERGDERVRAPWTRRQRRPGPSGPLPDGERDEQERGPDERVAERPQRMHERQKLRSRATTWAQTSTHQATAKTLGDLMRSVAATSAAVAASIAPAKRKPITDGYTTAFPRARSSGDRARASGARGRRFESSRAHRMLFGLRPKSSFGGNHSPWLRTGRPLLRRTSSAPRRARLANRSVPQDTARGLTPTFRARWIRGSADAPRLLPGHRDSEEVRYMKLERRRGGISRWRSPLSSCSAVL